MKDGRMDQCQQCLYPDKKGLHTCFQQQGQVDMRKLREHGLGAQFANYSTSPIKVFTVCTDQESGRYMAFLGTDPTKKATAFSRESAAAQLLAEQKLIVMTEID